MSDVNVHLGRQRGEGQPTERMFCACVLCFEQEATTFSLSESSTLIDTARKGLNMDGSLSRGLLPPLSTIDVETLPGQKKIKGTTKPSMAILDISPQAFPFHFCILQSHQKLDGGKVWEQGKANVYNMLRWSNSLEEAQQLSVPNKIDTGGPRNMLMELTRKSVRV